MQIVKILFPAALSLLFPAWGLPAAAAAEQNAPAAPVPAGPEEKLPDAAMLQRLARRALFEATGVRMRVGPVILREKLPDGSYLVFVTLENGRRIRGRLFRRKRLYRIAVDRRDLFAREQTIEIVKEP